MRRPGVKVHYKAERKNFFFWKVVNEEGKSVHTGSELGCICLADMLNTVWDNGYAHGRYDEYQDAKREIGKLR